jgi:hypothetical protein
MRGTESLDYSSNVVRPMNRTFISTIARMFPSRAGLIAAGVVLGVTLSVAQAWTNPTAVPPGGNVSGPITTGALGQTKAGNLALNTGGVYQNALVAPTGNIGVGTLAPNTAKGFGGNIDANDMYVRSIGKWVSELGGGVTHYSQLPSGASAGYCGTQCGVVTDLVPPAALPTGPTTRFGSVNPCSCLPGWKSVLYGMEVNGNNCGPTTEGMLWYHPIYTCIKL